MMMRHTVNRVAVLALFLSPISLTAESGKDCLVSSSQVAHALSQAGRQVRADQIEFLTSVHTRQPNAVLKLISVEGWQDGLLKAELGCLDRTTCLPFVVLIRDAEARALVGNGGSELHAAAGNSKNHDVHVGDAAVLIFDRNDSRITMYVICVQSGDRGQKIRVATRDRRRFYEAEVIEPGVLKGTL